jgi:dUTP pyrophosphatase
MVHQGCHNVQYLNLKGKGIEMTLKLRIKKVHDKAIIPKYQTLGASGMDLCAVHAHTIFPGERRTVATGIAISIPDGYDGQIRPRSGLAAKQGITVLNSPGTIDSDYVGEIKVILFNTSDEVFSVCPGDRIAQLVVVPIVRVELEEVTCLKATARGEGGFGSTGSK